MLILDSISATFVSIGIWIVSGIYKFAAFAFQIFLLLADGSLLNEIDYETIVKNFYLVIGVIMLFILAFSMLKGMVNPDDSKQGTSTVKKVIVNLITSTIIMAILPTIFSFAFDFQKAFLYDYNPIGNFFGYGSVDSGTSNNSEIDNSIKTGAYQITNGVFTAFFYPGDGNYSIKSDKKFDYDGETKEYTLGDVQGFVDETGKFGLYTNFSKKADEGYIEFNFLLSLIASIILIYVAVSFCFDMAIRLVKLVLYQIIAPIPIFFRVMPDGKLSGTFNNWVKITLTCYMEVYIRIFVFYFCIYLCKAILAAGFFNSLSGYGFLVSTLAKAFVLMGIITFMRQAPKIISEVTGLDSGNMKLGIKEKLAAGGAFTAGAVVGGGITTGVQNLVNGGKNAINKYQQNIKAGKGKLESVWGASKTAIGGIGSTAAGFISGGVRSGKNGLNAKSFSDMKGAASSGASAAVNARDKRATYKANHEDNLVGVVKGHAKDAIRTAGEWAGIGVVSSAEAGYFESAANAFDSAHSKMESAYKGKPEHNSIKEDIARLNGEYSQINQQIAGLDFLGQLTEQQREMINTVKERNIEKYDFPDTLSREQREVLKNLVQRKIDVANQKDYKDTYKAEHEAKEMAKKMSMQMVAIQDLINAKTRYFDISESIFTDKLYSILKDSQGKGLADGSEHVKNLVTKIQQNQTLSINDFKDANGNVLINMNTLESFADKAGIAAKDLSAAKQVEISHAKALKDEKKGEKK
ncbi:MAG: hypothetical protein IKT40_09405 [Bacilli bacterium]|nr:hypothetical protein [Bacilli bacterium]